MSGLAQDVRHSGRVPLISGLARRWPITTFYLLTLAITWPKSVAVGTADAKGVGE